MLECPLSIRSDNLVEILVSGKMPEVGSQFHSESFQRAMRVIELLQLTKLSRKLQSVSAIDPNRMLLNFENTPTVLLASDRIEAGIGNMTIFFRYINEENRRSEESRKLETADYIDLRFGSSVYLGSDKTNEEEKWK